MISTRHRWLPFSILLSFFALMLASMGCQGLLPNSATASKTLTTQLSALSVSPASSSIKLGATQQFTATATYKDGSTSAVTSTASWTSSTPAIATANKSGLATAVSPGSTIVTATLSGLKATANLTVLPKTVTAISVSPTTFTIAAGIAQQFTATATYNDGSTANVSSSARWISSTPTVASINSTGLATGVATGSTTITASLSGFSGSASLSVATVTNLAVSPSTATLAVDAAQQLTATATYSNGSTSNVTPVATWISSTPTIAFVDSDGLAGGILAGSSTVTASLSGSSATAELTVTGSGANVPLFHFDAQRSGLNSGEGILSPANVSTSAFGKLFSYTLDGYVYGQPLLISNLVIGGAAHNVLYAATENDSVYAFDSDNYDAGTPLWKVSLLQAGETPMTTGPIQPVQGVTSTPAIDTSTNTMYVVSAQTSASGVSTFRVNALNIITGAPRAGSPVTINVSAAGANAGPLTTSCVQRAALLVNNGYLYIGFGGCHDGWLLAYQEQNLAAPPASFNSSPNLFGEGTYASAGGVWMGGGGPVADDTGNIYITTGNGPWDGQTAFSDSVLKFSPTLSMLDYFTPYVYQYMDCADADLASGGLLLIPGTAEAVAGGKTGKLYLVNTTDLGEESPNDAGATQTLWFESGSYPATCTDSAGVENAEINSYEIFGTASYFNGSVYLGVTPTAVSGVPALVRQFPYNGTLSQGAYVAPSLLEGSNGYTLFISADGASNGVVWLLDHGHPLQSGGTPSSASLLAYDPGLDTELYNSANHSADTPGFGIKFSSPMVANGKVYISTGHDTAGAGEIDVYGLK